MQAKHRSWKERVHHIPRGSLQTMEKWSEASRDNEIEALPSGGTKQRVGICGEVD